MALGETEILLIVVVLIVLFGASQIPKLARSMGQAKGEFNKAKREFNAEATRTEQGSSGPSEDQIRRTARDLGIDVEGKSLTEVKALIAQKLA